MILNAEQWSKFIAALVDDNKGEGVKRHYTDKPVFVVEEKELIKGFLPDCSEMSMWIDIENGDEFSTLEEYFNSLDDDTKSIIKSDFWTHYGFSFSSAHEETQCTWINRYGFTVEKSWCNTRWNFLCLQLTYSAAEEFQKEYKERYPGKETRIFVDSAYKWGELKSIIETILSGHIQYAEEGPYKKALDEIVSLYRDPLGCVIDGATMGEIAEEAIKEGEKGNE